jgi:putative membrane-bound dehydrogenase-like protein
MEAMTLPEGAAVNLYASDPEFSKPIQVNFDSLGRLWVASSETYPQITPGGVANDKIVVLEDTTGDGVADKSTVFADKLLIPTGVVPDGKGGAYVAASTDLLHFIDNDGDGVADERRLVFTGFGTEDTHHLIHTLRWGPGRLPLFQPVDLHPQPHRNRIRNTALGRWRRLAISPRHRRVIGFCLRICEPLGTRL